MRSPSRPGAAADRDALVVSLHDVAPHSWRAYAELVPRLAERGVDRMTLLVVPDWHGAAPLGGEPELVEWLSGLDTERFEICLHGYTHLALGGPPAGLWSRAVGRWYTAGEGEFLRIGYRRARERLAAGRQLLTELGFRVEGFTAPAWLLSDDARRALRDLGFLYTTYLARIEHLPTGARQYAPTLVWSVRAPWRRRLSRHWCRLWNGLNRRARSLRLAVHPGDLGDAGTLEQLLTLAGRAAAVRRPLTYAGLAARLWPAEPA